MKLQTIILNYRTPEMTLEAVEAARRALAAVDGGYRLDVVDNDSGDGSYARLAEACADFDDVEVHQTGFNGGFGFGNNYAALRALASDDPPELIYLLNSDAFPDPDAIARLVALMDERPDAGIAGSQLVGPEGDRQVSAFRFPSLASELVGSVRLGLLERALPEREVPIHPPPSRTTTADWLAGASMMIRAETFEDVGGFDEGYFLYFEETDLCRRAALRGWTTWYVVDSRCVHLVHGSTGLRDLNRPMPRYWFDSRRHYFRKNHGRAYAWAANAVHAAGLATYRVREKLQGKAPQDPARFLRDFCTYNFVLNQP